MDPLRKNHRVRFERCVLFGRTWRSPKLKEPGTIEFDTNAPCLLGSFGFTTALLSVPDPMLWVCHWQGLSLVRLGARRLPEEDVPEPPGSALVDAVVMGSWFAGVCRIHDGQSQLTLLAPSLQMTYTFAIGAVNAAENEQQTIKGPQ